MGCNSSKGVETTVYRPAPASFAVFDINSIQEPWIVLDATPRDQKPTHVPAQILDKLNSLESDPAPPNSWVEVSKVLEDLKPTSQPDPKPLPEPENPPPEKDDAAANKTTPSKSKSFHTLEELDAKLSAPKPAKIELRKTESAASLRPPQAPAPATSGAAGGGGTGSLKNNMFIVMDKMEREKEGKMAIYERMMKSKRDPLGDFPEKCPPGGGDRVVVYTTSLRGVRRTHEDCNRVKSIMELQRVVFDERDVSLHGDFLAELKELLGEEASVPRVFVKGRYLGGAEEVSDLNETGRLGRILTHAGVERGMGRLTCTGCGGARFVPCLECGGSCRVVVPEAGDKERCPKCNENGLVLCPACL